MKGIRVLIVLLASVGVVVSALALHVHYSTETQPCSINERWDCGVVNHSSYAEIAHVPVAALGVLGYLALIGLALMRTEKLLVGAACIGFAFALYLTHIEKDVLMVYCLYCVISQAVIALILLLGLSWIGLSWRRQKKEAAL
jgi:uncharacterized membrane protein